MPIEDIIQSAALWIAYAGVIIIFLGVIVTLGRFMQYLVTGFNEEKAARLRHSLMVYFALGLDFLIAKDIVLTLSLESADYEGVLQLLMVIGVRIVLSVFIHFEEGSLHQFKKKWYSELMSKKKK